MDQRIKTWLGEKQSINNAVYHIHDALGVMCLPHAQLVPLPRLLQTISFSSDHNSRWWLLNPSNHTHPKPPRSRRKASHSMSCTLRQSPWKSLWRDLYISFTFSISLNVTPWKIFMTRSPCLHWNLYIFMKNLHDKIFMSQLKYQWLCCDVAVTQINYPNLKHTR